MLIKAMLKVQPSYRGGFLAPRQKRLVISVGTIFKGFYLGSDVTPRARPKIDRAPTPIGAGKGYVLPGRPATTPQKPVQTLRKPTQPVGRVHPAVRYFFAQNKTRF